VYEADLAEVSQDGGMDERWIGFAHAFDHRIAIEWKSAAWRGDA